MPAAKPKKMTMHKATEHARKPAAKRTKIAKGESLPRGKASELRKKPGMGSVGKWKDVPKGDFAGPDGTYPIHNLAHARNALARAHYSPQAASIKRKVYAKYPALKKHHMERENGKKSEKAKK